MLHFQSIEKQYSLGVQSVPALRGVSGVVQQGEMLALCGPSGSGKSTLLNILGLLDPNYQGEVALEGRVYPRRGKSAALLRRTQFGFVFQKFNLVPVMTTLENVAYPLMLNGFSRRDQHKLAHDMLTKVGLEAVMQQRPDHLSGGQQQRVAIARALVHNPKLVVADEPTASLDSQTANLVISLMKSLGHELGTTFVVATHDGRMAAQCDRTLNLVDGQISLEAMQWAS
ncbi:ABC transporter ATP-binding protein [Vibrio cholerae]|nr:ABC transporter ATP-binding protein [Vibrio cholerae]EHY8702409.1 ABC transporter ATP-binding protein [Vibrio cholerae]EJL6667699.1 ABC transporter ATP-binding protein [Vibrio cholerae]ELY5264530.1 ABC transporter ATP-binding protein [Vibrio cholerae]